MKKNKLLLAIATVCAAFVLNAPAQVTTTTVDSMNSAGTISEFTPDTITIRSSAETAPVHYAASKTTTYVDETGTPVSMEVVKSGAPVTVYYTKSGDEMIASRVVVNRTTTTTTTPAAPVVPVVEEKKTTTTTTTEQ